MDRSTASTPVVVPEWVRRAQAGRLPISDQTGRIVVAKGRAS